MYIELWLQTVWFRWHQCACNTGTSSRRVKYRCSLCTTAYKFYICWGCHCGTLRGRFQTKGAVPKLQSCLHIIHPKVEHDRHNRRLEVESTRRITAQTRLHLSSTKTIEAECSSLWGSPHQARKTRVHNSLPYKKLTQQGPVTLEYYALSRVRPERNRLFSGCKVVFTYFSGK